VQVPLSPLLPVLHRTLALPIPLTEGAQLLGYVALCMQPTELTTDQVRGLLPSWQQVPDSSFVAPVSCMSLPPNKNGLWTFCLPCALLLILQPFSPAVGGLLRQCVVPEPAFCLWPEHLTLATSLPAGHCRMACILFAQSHSPLHRLTPWRPQHVTASTHCQCTSTPCPPLAGTPASSWKVAKGCRCYCSL
jgi:hypothetical protein